MDSVGHSPQEFSLAGLVWAVEHGVNLDRAVLKTRDAVLGAIRLAPYFTLPAVCAWVAAEGAWDQELLVTVLTSRESDALCQKLWLTSPSPKGLKKCLPLPPAVAASALNFKGGSSNCVRR